MNCTCKKDIEEKLTERFKTLTPSATEHSVVLHGYGINLGSGAEIGYLEARAEATYATKSGGSRRKTTKQNMLFSHCPFCGVKV